MGNNTSKVVSTETIEWPKFGYVIQAGVETELPAEKEAAAIVLAHPSVTAVSVPSKVSASTERRSAAHVEPKEVTPGD